jgi:cbb3-type cytochrome oxidase subunit 3
MNVKAIATSVLTSFLSLYLYDAYKTKAKKKA